MKLSCCSRLGFIFFFLSITVRLIRLCSNFRQLSDPVNYGFQQHEIALLGNLCPDNLDEALHLIPSLKVNISMSISPFIYICFSYEGSNKCLTLQQHMEDGSDKVEKAIVQVQSFCRH